MCKNYTIANLSECTIGLLQKKIIWLQPDETKVSYNMAAPLCLCSIKRIIIPIEDIPVVKQRQ